MNPPKPCFSPFKLLLIAVLSLLLVAPAFAVQPATAQASQADQYYHKNFEWDYNGKHWTWNLSIPEVLYDAYKSVPVNTRTRSGPSGYGFLTTTQDPYIRSLAVKLNETANSQGYGSYDKVSFALAFVQSLTYTSDDVTEGYNEYPRFPVETLVDEGGDCEDTSILFASLTLVMGYGTVYINPPNHYAVGILGNGLQGASWTYPQGSNNTYYYCETTGSGFKIGQIPNEFSGESAYIYPIEENRQYIPAVAVAPTPTNAPVTGSNTPPPTVTNPDIQDAMPLSFNLLLENPVLSVTVAVLIAFSVSAAIWSVRRTKHEPPSPNLEASELPSESDKGKFCIYCGEGNKGHAVYCEKCGKQIGQVN